MVRVIPAAGLALLLAACASSDRLGPSTSAPAGPSVISGSGSTGSALAIVAGPAGCAGPISEYLQIIDADAESGALNPGVYNRVTTDLGAVKQACAAGREAEARSQLAAVKARYGYR
ncbi:MAG: hypothetical protein WD871_06530 [Xanthobacteraceae bacterium]